MIPVMLLTSLAIGQTGGEPAAPTPDVAATPGHHHAAGDQETGTESITP